MGLEAFFPPSRLPEFLLVLRVLLEDDSDSISINKDIFKKTINK